MKFGFRLDLIVATLACLLIGDWVTGCRPAQAGESGKIYLVGMGPGDPDLATVRAVRIVKNADKVFCFGYLADTVASMAKPDALEQVAGLLAKRYYGSNHRMLPEKAPAKEEKARQCFAEFAAKVRRLVAEGKTVAIVDSGDPLIFGAWAWVTEEFGDLPLEVVPGVSSFNAANAALRRDVMWGGRRCVVLTGGDVLGLPPHDGRMSTPSVFFTHRTPLEQLMPRLLEQYPADTPVAVVCNAGQADRQQVIQATLGTISERLADGELPFLNLVYVGDILTLKHKNAAPSANKNSGAFSGNR